LSLAPVAPENMKALHGPGSLAAITCGNLPAKRTMREASQQSININTQTKKNTHNLATRPACSPQKETMRRRYAPQVQHVMMGPD